MGGGMLHTIRRGYEIECESCEQEIDQYAAPYFLVVVWDKGEIVSKKWFCSNCMMEVKEEEIN